MKKLLLMILAAMWLVFPLAKPAQADDKLDMGKVTCAEFLELDPEEIAYLYFWLDGYLSAKSGDLVLDPSTAESDVEELMKACRANKNSTLLKVLGQ